jgi:hypothetical protein
LVDRFRSLLGQSLSTNSFAGSLKIKVILRGTHLLKFDKYMSIPYVFARSVLQRRSNLKRESKGEIASKQEIASLACPARTGGLHPRNDTIPADVILSKLSNKSTILKTWRRAWDAKVSANASLKNQDRFPMPISAVRPINALASARQYSPR